MEFPDRSQPVTIIPATFVTARTVFILPTLLMQSGPLIPHPMAGQIWNDNSLSSLSED